MCHMRSVRIGGCGGNTSAQGGRECIGEHTLVYFVGEETLSLLQPGFLRLSVSSEKWTSQPRQVLVF